MKACYVINSTGCAMSKRKVRDKNCFSNEKNQNINSFQFVFNSNIYLENVLTIKKHKSSYKAQSSFSNNPRRALRYIFSRQ